MREEPLLLFQKEQLPKEALKQGLSGRNGVGEDEPAAEGLLKVDSLTEHLQPATDNGAKRVLLPLENKRDFADIPSDVLGRLQLIFYSDPINAAFWAMGLK